jgi:hypothetical protein
MNIEELRYPIGKFQLPEHINVNQLEEWKKDIASFPSEIKALSQNLNAVELNYKYRPEGWSVQQLVHHCADSHMNGFIRHKLTLSEDRPQIKPYIEAKWAEMSDTLEVNIEESLKIIEGVHRRWAVLLNSIGDADLKREYIHPQYGINYTLAQSIGNYAWHGKHHLAHIKNALTTKELY